MNEFDSPDLLKALESIEKRDYASAFKLLNSLAEAGNPRAQCNLAMLYQFGWGVGANGKKAVELYKRVGELRLKEGNLSGIAYNNLATICFTGLRDVEKDVEQGEKYAALARERGFPM